MADYWKSLPKKYCDFCKCWITDNKASVDFHEKGKKHQDNVSRRLAELRKKGEIDYRKQQQVNTDLKKMEEAALRAYHKDLTTNPDITARNIADKHSHVAKVIENAASNPRSLKTGEAAALQAAASLGSGPGPSLPLLPPPKVWHEALSPEGYSYYWNAETNETTWEPPPEGYVSLLEQQLEELKESESSSSQVMVNQPMLHKKSKKKKKKRNLEPSYSNNDDEDYEDNEGDYVPEKPYGEWQTVDPKHETVTVQLPKIQYNNHIKNPVLKEEPKINFKEKTAITPLSSFVKQESGIPEFKKRKITSDIKRNIRQREEIE